ncbi:MAG TPA: phytoene desaturase family protein [Chloroflexota bacterium]|nr:phytoene desaturase family protein [Chloroflexota bacterium]
MKGSVAVIGGGIGGLATAIRLANRGHAVTVFEKNASLGGRCNLFQRDGFTFDTGPTLLLMRDVLDDFFASVGRDTSSYVSLRRVNPNYDIIFGDGSRLQITGDRDELLGSLERLAPNSSSGFSRYMEDAGFKYRVARERFVERNFRSLREFATLPNLRLLIATQALRKLDVHARRYFQDERLQAAFTFQAMYLGLSPSKAPSIYSLLSYTELNEGIWFPMGGMYRLVDALVRLAAEMGVNVRTMCAVDRILVRDRRVRGVQVAGEKVAADIVVSNADLRHTYSCLLPPQVQGPRLRARLATLRQGSSAYLLFLGAPRAYTHAGHHTVFLSADIRGNYRTVFNERRLPHDPSMYLCIASRTDPSLAPAGRDGIYVLVPVPHATTRVDWRVSEGGFRQTVLRRVESLGFPDASRGSFIHALTPEDLASAYNLPLGSAFGLAHNFLQVGYMRPANRAPGLENMYFVGASTVPGGGVPMVIIGSRLTAERIIAEQDTG